VGESGSPPESGTTISSHVELRICQPTAVSFSVFPCCVSYYVIVNRVLFTVLYTRVHVVKPMGHA